MGGIICLSVFLVGSILLFYTNSKPLQYIWFITLAAIFIIAEVPDLPSFVAGILAGAIGWEFVKRLNQPRNL